MRACWRCGSGRLAADWDGELRCLSWGRTPPADQTPAAVARLTGLSPRTIARWIDAGLVAASSPRGSGRPRLVDTGGVIRLVAERRTLERVVRVGDPAGDLAAAAGPRLTMESFGFGWQSGSLIPSPVQRQHPWGLVVAGNAVRPGHFSPRAAGARFSPPHT